jgi:hypothetical protein
MLNPEAFFAHIRATIFGGNLTQSQVDGINAILAFWSVIENVDFRFVAYALATAYWETDRTLQPIAEYGKGHGHSYGLPDPDTGKVYYGRGLVQLTWKFNYVTMSQVTGVDLVNNPELALQPDIAAHIMVDGMLRGRFTGKKLIDFFHGVTSDWLHAREIINGLDHAQDIAGYAFHFFEALQKGA